jgi:hypothetical protein
MLVSNFLAAALRTGHFEIQAELLFDTPQDTFADGVHELGPFLKLFRGNLLGMDWGSANILEVCQVRSTT